MAIKIVAVKNKEELQQLKYAPGVKQNALFPKWHNRIEQLFHQNYGDLQDILEKLKDTLDKNTKVLGEGVGSPTWHMFWALSKNVLKMPQHNGLLFLLKDALIAIRNSKKVPEIESKIALFIYNSLEGSDIKDALQLFYKIHIMMGQSHPLLANAVAENMTSPDILIVPYGMKKDLLGNLKKKGVKFELVPVSKVSKEWSMEI